MIRSGRQTWEFDFIVPARKLSGPIYVFVRPNLKVAASAAYLWDDSGDSSRTPPYARVRWELPLPDGDFSDSPC